ncbi:acyltransferase [Novosphingobium sp. ST904]|uniref:acyltransferase family protein n=1 Tax=Novosphingobium sp. ST904 TaxID=1684385 RepID=UPI0014046045|nr:acyltransferase [Novosphingobium sp. ST904]
MSATATRPAVYSDKAYNPTIDTLKGALILLVMVGHLFTAKVDGNPVKWGIYAFHMPLFLGLGGFLLTVESLRRLSFRSLWKKYDTRMLLPWAFAFLLWISLDSVITHEINISYFIEALREPPYHTWYIPVFFFFIVIAWAGRYHFVLTSLIGIFLGVFGLLALGVGHYTGPWRHGFPIDYRYLTMMPFFFFGFWLRQRGASPPNAWIALLVAAAFSAYEACYFYPANAAEIFPYLALNFSMIAGMPWLFRLHWKVPIVTEIGRESLYFYLWHPFILIVLKKATYHLMPEAIAGLFALVFTIATMWFARMAICNLSWLSLLAGLPRRAHLKV